MTRCQTHKYVRDKLGEKVIYKCANCSSYVFGHLILGRESICNGCGKTFKIGLTNLQAKPHCGCLTDYYLNKYKLARREHTPPTGNVKEELIEYLMDRIKK